MARNLVRQDDGKWSIYDTVVDTLTHVHLTASDVLDFYFPSEDVLNTDDLAARQEWERCLASGVNPQHRTDLGPEFDHDELCRCLAWTWQLAPLSVSLRFEGAPNRDADYRTVVEWLRDQQWPVLSGALSILASSGLAMTSREGGRICQGCRRRYKVDFMVPYAIWEKIRQNAPNDCGLLCGECITRRIEAIGDFAAFELRKI